MNAPGGQRYGDWEPEVFQRWGAEVLGLIGGHFESIRTLPVAVPTDPAELVAALDGDLPEEGEDFARVLADTRDLVIPNLVHWNHPRFFGYFPTCASLPGVLAETLTAALNVNTMLWATSPAASALERVVLRWIAQLVGYPEQADGILLDGASLATLYALVAARDAALGPEVRMRGIAGPETPALSVYASDQAHSSVDRAALTLGFGLDHVVRVDSDADYRMCPEALDRAIRRDLAAGTRPVAVVATLGTTSVGAADPLVPIAEVCARHGVWLHVDAAYGGFWRAAPALWDRTEDPSVGDSFVVNPQKCLYVPLDSTALFCRRPGALRAAFQLVPDYLRSEHRGDEIDFMNLSPHLGRGFRALKVWWVMRTFGRAGYATRFDEAVTLAEALRAVVAAHPDWRCPVPSDYPLVGLRYEPRVIMTDQTLSAPDRRELLDGLNADIVAAVNASGSAYVSATTIRDGNLIRVAIGNIRTTQADVDELWRVLNRVAEERLSATYPRQVRAI
jgi:aromatic-L-amino-acid decarboxylase